MKLIIEEPESSALQSYLRETDHLATSGISEVEVSRAVTLANPSGGARAEADRLLASCLLVPVGAHVLRAARNLTSASVRTLDAIHLASALRIEADEMLAYDRRLLEAATTQGLATVSPS